MANSRNSGSPDAFLSLVAVCLRHHLPADQVSRLAVGFSGGRDSVALLQALCVLRDEFDFRLEACHVNHQLSPRAFEWQAFCERFCEMRGVPLTIHRVEVPRRSGIGLEAAARAARYEVFGRLGVDWVLLAQHRGDQAETLLFNLLRGAGVRGAAAIPETRKLRPGVTVLRPMLKLSRQAIEAYLLDQSLCWVDDESNQEIGFSRNFLRHKVMPVLQGRFSAAEANLAAAAGRFGEAIELLDELAMLDLNGLAATFPIPVRVFADLPERRARNVLRFLMYCHGVRIPSEARLAEGLRQLVTAGIDRHPSVTFGGRRLFRQRDSVQIEKIGEDELEE